MKSKIDEVIGRLELISFNLPKEYDSDETPAWWVSLFAVKEQLEQLRPYVELGEMQINIHNLSGKRYYNVGESLNSLYIERDNLINQIKEQRDV